jgi:hypothetical protein
MTQPKQKIVFQTNHEQVLIGTCLADESPLEPGVWMIPGGCVEVATPEIPGGKQARWAAGAWIIEDAPAPIAEPVAPPVVNDQPGLETRVIVQAYMDQTAQLSGYESLLAAISYADEDAVESFQQDGKRFRAWRSLVWAYVFQQQALAVEEPDRELTILEILQGLPELPGEHPRIDLDEWHYLTQGQ